jgi:hypothetical protein
MLLYAYFAKRGKRKDEEFLAQQNASSQDSAHTPHLVISGHTGNSGEKSPTSPLDGAQTPGGTLSPAPTAPPPGLTPLDSHVSSTTSTQFHHEHPDVSSPSFFLIHKLTKPRQRDVHATNTLSADRERCSTLFDGNLSPLATNRDHRDMGTTPMPRNPIYRVTCQRLLQGRENARTSSST